MPSLRILNLTRNKLSSWDEILRAIRIFPRLESLILSYNDLTSLTSSIAPPSTLLHLSLSHNNLTTLTSLPTSLSSLEIISGNPLFSSLDELSARMELIARFGGLKRLEKTEIREGERRECERWWIGMIDKKEKGKMLEGDWEKGREEELRRKHDLPLQSLEPSPPTSIKSRFINLTFLLPPSLSTSTSSTISLSLLPTLRTMLLRSHLSRSLSTPIPKTKYQFWAILKPAQEGEKELEVEIPRNEEGRELKWWGLEEGDKIRVEEV